MNGQVLRLLDANANRAREALRVLEDYTRFVLDDSELSALLKGARHDLSDAIREILPDAILHRDTPGDVGTVLSTAAETKRSDLGDVVIAGGKRLGEALRAIEEFLKVISPARAAEIERVRYRFYEIERRIALTLRPAAACVFANVRLYVLITEQLCKMPWIEAAAQAIEGGADALQLREKELDGAELLTRARALAQLCRKHKVLCIINDRVDIAILSDADGVHLGQSDFPATDARKLLGAQKLIGVSTHNITQAKQARLDGADYIGVGPFFRSSTKPRDFIAGPEYGKQVSETFPDFPAVAIAGITARNVDEVLATGIHAVAVSSAVIGATDVRAAAAEMKKSLAADQRG